ncbi:MAG: DUF4444 domain-containing protein [Marinibacterium sp.]
MTGPALPPLMSAEPAISDPFEQACLRAVQGCDAGLMVYRQGPVALEAALVFAPDVPLAQALTMLPLCGVGFQNALGALAPPEVAVHLGWDGSIHVNGARCGGLRVAASDRDPAGVPDWLVVGLTVWLVAETDRPGDDPERTVLYAEGCTDVSPIGLIEAWGRHVLNWIGRWESDGAAALHAEWRGLARNIGEEMTQGGRTGTFLGVDENFGMLLRDGDRTHLIGLDTLLEERP